MTALLAVESLTKAFSGLVALSEVSFDVAAGTIHGVIGPNGAGKTTLFNLVTAVFPPTSGRVRFAGQEITNLAPHKIARLGIARTFQTVRLFGELTVAANTVIGTHRHTKAGLVAGLLGTPGAAAEHRRSEAEAMESLTFVGLADLAGQRADVLPFGQQRLLEVARALALRPQLLLLDEPAAGLNDNETEKLAQLIRLLPGRGITVVLVEHNMDLMMSVADRLVVLTYGTKLAEGTPDEIQANEAVVNAYLGEDEPA